MPIPLRFLMPLLVAGLASSIGRPPLAAEEFRLLTWNVESNRPGSRPVSDARVIASQLVSMLRRPATRAEIVALSEVAPADVLAYRRAVEIAFRGPVDHATSASGGFRDADSLLLVVDARRFRIEEVAELHRYAGITANFNLDDPESPEHGTLRARSPLAVRLRDTDSDQTFWLVVVHLARGEADLRTDQARMLQQWAADQDGPVIAAGDFNFDFDFRTRQGNPGFDAMLAGGTWQWLEPDPLIDTNWAADRDDPSRDRYPDSILDFVFVANAATRWQGESDVVVREKDFPDDERTSDHRPLITSFRPE
jgi:endonuclease/exonuclease/phosphatase family metal-dependent hydrolase